MKQAKITRDDFRKMKVGECRHFQLPNPGKCQSARMSASQMAAEGMVFSCKCPREWLLKGKIAITRLQ